MMSLREILQLLLALSFVKSITGKKNFYTGWTQKFDNQPYLNQTAEVGDTITFIWTIDQIQNVFIHPTNDCTQTGRIPVGNISPTEYTFQPEDAGKSIFFANDIDDRCENFGMRLIVNVLPLSGVTNEPTEAPSAFRVPTEAPVFPTLAPVIPTLAPVFPTMAPVFPTLAPVFPTLAPVVPTLAPVVPTFAPVPPTLAPVVPTSAPVDPTLAPVAPTFPPIAATDPPTFPPTSSPTNEPTDLPTTLAPTIPVGVPVADPTSSPTESIISKITQVTIRDLQMTLTGIDSFPEETEQIWIQETEKYSTSYYEDELSGESFQTSIVVTNAFASIQRERFLRRGLKRQLQEGKVVVTYNQVVSYSSAQNDAISEDLLAKAAFATAGQRDKFVNILQNTKDPVLEAVTDSSPVTYASEVVPTSAPVPAQPVIPPDSPSKKSGLSMAAIIGIACGGGAIIIIVILFCIYCKMKKSNSGEKSSPPPQNVSIREDEVSTLAGPSVAGNAAGQGDKSVGTVDYDYSKAYGNGEHSVSSAGGTFGSNTQNLTLPLNAGATGAALGPYDDNGSYDQHFRNSGSNVKEEILHVFAPPGKLGVVIDTPDDGAPVVHAVKETSVVFDKVQVGDKLMAVDDEDVRTLTAIKVSKLISRKSANPSRKLTILRTTHLG